MDKEMIAKVENDAAAFALIATERRRNVSGRKACAPPCRRRARAVKLK
jgi:hypothetical protein